MLNVLVPLGGKSTFFPSEEFFYPKSLVEIRDRPMIQHVIENLRSIDPDPHFTFILNKEDCADFHLDKVLRLLCGDDTGIVQLHGQTMGAACSCLMAIESIPADEPLIIANSDQILEIRLQDVVQVFSQDNADAGLIVFDSVHPRWSFARIENGCVVETGEKHPISSNAIAGFYYFSRASLFFESAMKSIRRNAIIDGKFFIAPVFNEMILENKKICAWRIENSKFHTLYTPQKISEYEKYLEGKSTNASS